MHRLALGLLQLTVLTMPWETIVTLPGMGTTTRALGFVAAIAGLLGVTFRGRVRRPSVALVLIACFLLWSTLTVFWAIDPRSASARISTFAQLFALVWLMWEYAPLRQAQAALMRAYVVGAWVPIVLIGLEFASGGATSLGVADSRYSAVHQDPNDLGVTLAIGVPMAWYLMVGHKGWLGKAAYGAYLPAASAAILLTASRGAFLAGLVAVGFAFWSFSRIGLRSKLLATSLAAVTGYAVLTTVPQSSFERLWTIRAEIETGHVGGRGEIWTAGVREFLHRPLLGAGAGGFGAAVEGSLRTRRASHSAFLSILVEEGVIGFVIFATAWGVLLVRTRAMVALEQRFWLILALTWLVGALSLSWDYRKPTWFVLGLLTTRVGVRTPARVAMPAPLRQTP